MSKSTFALIVLAVIGLASLPFLAFALAQMAPGFNAFIVVSGSMEPEIDTGSVLFTRSIDPSLIEVGETITFRTGDQYTTHKVVNKSKELPHTFRTKGIANEAPDPQEVSANQIVGVKLFSVPYLGYAINFAGSPLGILILVALPASTIVILEVIEALNDFRE